jgi:hypothetical protein
MSAGVCGLVDLLLTSEEGPIATDDETKRYLCDIRNETDLMTAILNDVLDLGECKHICVGVQLLFSTYTVPTWRAALFLVVSIRAGHTLLRVP